MPKVIGEIIQNGGEFPVVDANNIRGGVYSVNSATEMRAIPKLRLKAGMMCYVSEETSYYHYINGNWIKLSLSGSDSPSSGCDCVIDSSLSSSSTNPLENRAIYSLLQGIYNRLSALENGGSTTTHTLSVVLSASPTAVTKGDTTTLSWVVYYDGVIVTNAVTVNSLYVNGEEVQQTIDSSVRSYIRTVNTDENYKITVSYNGLYATSNTVSVTAAEETHTLSVELSGPSAATTDEMFTLSWKILYDGVEVGTDTAVTSQSIVYKGTMNGGFKQSSNTIRSNQFGFTAAGTYSLYAIVEYQGLTATSNTISVDISEAEETHTYAVSVSPSTVTIEEGESATFTFIPTIDGSSDNVEITGFGVIDDSGVVTNGTDTTFTLTKNSLTAGTHTYTLNVDFSDGGTASTTFTVIVNEVEETTTVYYGRSQADPTAETYTSFNAATMAASETSGTYDFADVGSPTETYNFYYLIVPKTMYISSDVQVSLASPLEDMWETATEIEGTDYKFYRSLQRQSGGNEIKVNYNSSSDNATYVRDREFTLVTSGSTSDTTNTLAWIIKSEGSTVQTGSGNPLNALITQKVKAGSDGTQITVPTSYREYNLGVTVVNSIGYIEIDYRNNTWTGNYEFSDVTANAFEISSLTAE